MASCHGAPRPFHRSSRSRKHHLLTPCLTGLRAIQQRRPDLRKILQEGGARRQVEGLEARVVVDAGKGERPRGELDVPHTEVASVAGLVDDAAALPLRSGGVLHRLVAGLVDDAEALPLCSGGVLHRGVAGLVHDAAALPLGSGGVVFLHLLEVLLRVAGDLDRSPGGDEVLGYAFPFAAPEDAQPLEKQAAMSSKLKKCKSVC